MWDIDATQAFIDISFSHRISYLRGEVNDLVFCLGAYLQIHPASLFIPYCPSPSERKCEAFVTSIGTPVFSLTALARRF